MIAQLTKANEARSAALLTDGAIAKTDGLVPTSQCDPHLDVGIARAIVNEFDFIIGAQTGARGRALYRRWLALRDRVRRRRLQRYKNRGGAGK